MLKEIAGQAQLLALNALIDAARAGEPARDIAVVAHQARALAERTSEATLKIEQVIGAIRAETTAAIAAMQAGPQVAAGIAKAASAEALLREIMHSAAATLSRIRDVAGAASTPVAAPSDDASRVVGHTTESTLATAQSVEKLEALASNLQSQVAKFRV